MNHYELLQVSPGASKEIIEAAYKALIKRMHPDAGGSHQATLALNEARNVLLDPERRNQYDAELHLKNAGSRGNDALQVNNGSSKSPTHSSQAYSGAGNRREQGQRIKTRSFRTELELIRFIGGQETNAKTLFVQQNKLFDRGVALSGWAEIDTYFNYGYQGLSDAFFCVKLYCSKERLPKHRVYLYFEKDVHPELVEILGRADKPVPLSVILVFARERYDPAASDVLAYGTDWTLLDFGRRGALDGNLHSSAACYEELFNSYGLPLELKADEPPEELKAIAQTIRFGNETKAGAPIHQSKPQVEPADFFYWMTGSQAFLMPILTGASFAYFYYGPGHFIRTISDFAMFGLVSLFLGLLGGIAVLFLVCLATMFIQFISRLASHPPMYRREVEPVDVRDWTRRNIKIFIPLLSVACFLSFYLGSGKKIATVADFALYGISSSIFGLIGALVVLFLVGLLTFFIQLLCLLAPLPRHPKR
jgi:hypothetical protein